MKVLILITKSNWGGAQRYVYDLATNFPKGSYDVEVLAGGNGVLIDNLKESGIKASGDLPVGRDISVSEDLKVFFQLISIFRKKRPDVLHVNSSKIGGLGALAARLTGVPKIIFTAHGWAFNENRSWFSKIVIKFLHWITIVLSHQTIAVSEKLKEQMMYWPLVSEKITVVHNGIKDHPTFSKINARFELGKVNEKFANILKSVSQRNLTIIGSVGELHHVKGYKYAIEGVKGFIENLKQTQPSQKVVYVIMGEGDNRIETENEIRVQGLEESIILFGRVPSAFQYFKAFDIYLMPSLSEGLPYVMLEAGLASMPVIATAVGGIPEIIDDMETGVLIQPRKPKEIQHALEFLISHKKSQKEYGSALRKKILEEFSINKMIVQTLKVYHTSKKKK